MLRRKALPQFTPTIFHTIIMAIDARAPAPMAPQTTVAQPTTPIATTQDGDFEYAPPLSLISRY